MSERKYSVSEIDALRQVCSNRWLWGTSVLDNRCTQSRCYTEAERVESVEAWVRTYMLAGLTAEDIREEDRKLATR